jgi:UDP-N-acetylglucosamine/UDP-N-acetyl-alpha-D-glucosaminouronate 4-epimerase
MSSYLVTGGAGFIGSHLVDELTRRGQRVRVVDNLSTGHRKNLPEDAEFLVGDLADLEVAKRAVAGIEYVLHQAAIPSVPRSILNPIESHRSNVDATLNLLVAARDAGVQRLVYAGSSSAYGNTPTLPKREDMPASPLSPYALQKLVGEQYARLFPELYGLSTVTTRYFNVFGPRQDPSSPYSGVISLFISALVDGRAPTIFGDGGQTRDFTYVSNVVDGVLRACHHPAANGIFNIAVGDRVSLKDLFYTLRELVGSDVEPLYGPARAGDVRDSQADLTRARDILGYAPLVSLRDGLTRTIEWYRAQPARKPVATLSPDKLPLS